MLLVRVGNVEFHGHTDRGFLIGPRGFRGWEGAPATRREAADRPGGHGQFRSRPFKGGRLLTLAGTALASSEAELIHLGDVLSGIGQQDVRITVTTEAGTRWADGSVEGPIIFERVGGASEADFEVSFLLPDPFKYGETRTSVSSPGVWVPSWHRGNAPAHPKFTVTATTALSSGYALVGKDNKIFWVATALAAGKTATIDFRTGIVRHDGVRVTFVTPGTWAVNGGEEVGWQLVPNNGVGTGTATCYVTDTFV